MDAKHKYATWDQRGFDETYYDIPDASRYKMRKRGSAIYRILKSGVMKEIKQTLIIRKDGYRFRQVNITYDDTIRRTLNTRSLYRKLQVLNGDTPAGWFRSLPEDSEWIHPRDLSPEYFINRQGYVYRFRKDFLGNPYYTKCHYVGETVERVNLHNSLFKQRTYTRTAIKKMWAHDTGYRP